MQPITKTPLLVNLNPNTDLSTRLGSWRFSGEILKIWLQVFWWKCFQKCFGRKYFVWPLASFACGTRRYQIPKFKKTSSFDVHSHNQTSL